RDRMQPKILPGDIDEGFDVVDIERSADGDTCGLGIAYNQLVFVVPVELGNGIRDCRLIERNHPSPPTELGYELRLRLATDLDLVRRDNSGLAGFEIGGGKFLAGLGVQFDAAFEQGHFQSFVIATQEEFGAEVGYSASARRHNEWPRGIVLNLKIGLTLVEPGMTFLRTDFDSEHCVCIELDPRSVGKCNRLPAALRRRIGRLRWPLRLQQGERRQACHHSRYYECGGDLVAAQPMGGVTRASRRD